MGRISFKWEALVCLAVVCKIWSTIQKSLSQSFNKYGFYLSLLGIFEEPFISSSDHYSLFKFSMYIWSTCLCWLDSFDDPFASMKLLSTKHRTDVQNIFFQIFSNSIVLNLYLILLFLNALAFKILFCVTWTKAFVLSNIQKRPFDFCSTMLRQTGHPLFTFTNLAETCLI